MYKRRLLGLTALVLTSLAVHGAADAVRICLLPEQAGRIVPERFLGMSFEPSDVRRPSRRYSDIFAVDTCFWHCVKLLRPGVIRIGGMRGDEVANKTVPDPEGMDSLLEFARSLGWIVDWQMRFAPPDAEPVIPSISYLLAHGGDLLRYVSIGNEPDHFVGQGKRLAGWGLDAYLSEHAEYLCQMTALFPGLSWIGPDISERDLMGGPEQADTTWLERFATRFAPKLAGLSVHLYPVIREAATMTEDERLRALLSQETRLEVAHALQQVLNIGQTHGLPVYITETNAAVEEPGTAGTYNKMASALNVLDFLFLAAESGAQGAMVHVGELTAWTQSPLRYSVGMFDIGRCEIRPLFYAMVLFSTAAPQRFIGIRVEKKVDDNCFAYAFFDVNGKMAAVVVNKELDRAFDVELALVGGCSAARSISLKGDWRRASAALGDARIYESGLWSPIWDEHAVLSSKLVLAVPAATATLIVFDSEVE
jgi:hypothetical protein